MSNYKEIPISAAKRIAEQFEKNQVIIVTWDAAHEMVHVTTYGKTKQDSIIAADGGNFIKKALGWPEHLCHDVPEWWREERDKLLGVCKLALIEMQNADAHVEAMAKEEGKLGSYNPWFTEEIRQLRAVIANAERTAKN